jgi:hypothetical protein
MISAALPRKRLAIRMGGWNAALLAAASYLIVVTTAAVILPGVNEVS